MRKPLTAALTLLALLWWAASVSAQTILPPGQQTVTETLLPPGGATPQGWSVIGAGMCGPADASPFAGGIARDTATTLRRGEGFDDALFQMRGAYGRLADLTLLGVAGQPKDFAPRNGTGVWVYHSGRFNGCKGTIERASFAYFADAIRTANKTSDHGNDNLGVRDAFFAHCNSALTVGAVQSMHHTLERWHVRKCDRVINVNAGGKITLRSLDTDCQGTLLYLAGTAKEIGPNNGTFTLRDVTVDAAGDGVLHLVQEPVGCVARVSIEHLAMPSSRYSFDAQLQGKDSVLYLSRVDNFPASARFYLSAGARVVVSHSELPKSIEDCLVGDGVLVVESCWVGGRWVDSWVIRARGK